MIFKIKIISFYFGNVKNNFIYIYTHTFDFFCMNNNSYINATVILDCE